MEERLNPKSPLPWLRHSVVCCKNKTSKILHFFFLFLKTFFFYVFRKKISFLAGVVLGIFALEVFWLFFAKMCCKRKRVRGIVNKTIEMLTIKKLIHYSIWPNKKRGVCVGKCKGKPYICKFGGLFFCLVQKKNKHVYQQLVRRWWNGTQQNSAFFSIPWH